jgi:hypothetical protein
MPDSRPSGLGMTFLVGGMLLITAMALVITFIPLATCPLCSGAGVLIPWGSEGDSEGRVVITPCKYCSETGRISYFTKWTQKKNAQAR